MSIGEKNTVATLDRSNVTKIFRDVHKDNEVNVLLLYIKTSLQVKVLY